jgi:uncharacterized iron-regulated protein
MKFAKILTIFLLIFIVMSFISDKPAYLIYNKKGKKSDYDKLLKSASKADILLFGEYHDNPIIHWLEYEFTSDLFDLKQKDLVLGAEMFEADNQLVMNEYLDGKISNKTFSKEAKVWPNHKTDYLPLIEFAKDNNIPFIATNIPRRYSSMVYKHGFESLDELSVTAKSWIAPLPIAYDSTLPGYVNMLDMGNGHGGENLPKTQATKDATMAHFILKNYQKGKLFIHYNGAYHSNDFEGIMWYLKQANPKLNILTISVSEQAAIDTLAKDATGIADFIISVPESMTKTY